MPYRQDPHHDQSRRHAHDQHHPQHPEPFGGQWHADGTPQGRGQAWFQPDDRSGMGREGSGGPGGGSHQPPSGPHVGKGPKGYTRSDDRIREEVSDELMAAGDVDASEVEVEVANGEVTLRGSVDTRAAKRRAEDLIEHIRGVANIQNLLRVGAHNGGNGAASPPRGSTDRRDEPAGHQEPGAMKDSSHGRTGSEKRHAPGGRK